MSDETAIRDSMLSFAYSANDRIRAEREQRIHAGPLLTVFTGPARRQYDAAGTGRTGTDQDRERR